MRAKILLVSGEPATQSLALSIQEVLTEIAVAFGHSFVIKEEVIGERSLTAYGTGLTQEVVEQAADCDITLCMSAAVQEHISLASGLNCVLGCHSMTQHPSLGGHSLLKSEAMPVGVLMYPMRTDSRAMLRATKTALSLAASGEQALVQIPFSGQLSDVWQEAVVAAAPANVKEMSLSQALQRLIHAPEGMGYVYANPSASDALLAASITLSGLPTASFYSSYWLDKPELYGCVVTNALDDGISPFGVLQACVHMLKHVLGLTREADCLNSSLHNVMDAGWRTLDMTPGDLPRIGTNAVCRLISEQIALAGQLMTK